MACYPYIYSEKQITSDEFIEVCYVSGYFRIPILDKLLFAPTKIKVKREIWEAECLAQQQYRKDHPFFNAIGAVGSTVLILSPLIIAVLAAQH